MGLKKRLNQTISGYLHRALKVGVLAIVFTVAINYSLLAQVVEKTYVTTDREVYTQNDTLWFKGYVFDTNNFLSDRSNVFHLILSDVFGNKISTTSWPILNAMTYGNLKLPNEEGKYFIHAYSGQMAGSNTKQVFQKEIHVRLGEEDIISLKLLTKKPLYQSGNSLPISIIAQAGSEKQENLRLNYEVWDNSEVVATGKVKTNEEGIATVNLDKLNPNGNNFHILLTTDGSGVRKSKLTVPIVLDKQKIDLQFFPEGGKLVSPLLNNIAFKALNEKGLPIDIKGELVDKSGNSLASIQSFYKGTGQFKLQPQANKDYFFRIIEPIGIDSLYKLPQAYTSGTIISIDSSNVADIFSITFQSTVDLLGKKATFELTKNQEVIGQSQFALKSKQTIRLPLEKLTPGIYKLRLKDQLGIYLTERLLFVKSLDKLNISISTNKKAFKAREKVEALITVKDSNGQPIAGDFSVSAVYRTRSLIPDSNQPNLLAQILLQSELKGHIPTPNFYFSKDIRAVQALDLVMLTNGWRTYKPSKLRDPEAIVGKVQIKMKKRRPFQDASINTLMVKTNELKSFDLTDSGTFKINSSLFKDKGDSVLIFVNIKSKKLTPNIILDDSYKDNNALFQSSILNSYPTDIRHDIYLPAFKLIKNKFQGVTMLNSAEVTTKRPYFRNGCTLLERDSEGWITKSADQLDLTKPGLIDLLKQVSPLIQGYGKIHADNLSRQSFNGFYFFFLKRFYLATNAIISTEKVRSKYFITDVLTVNYEMPIPYELCINCECSQIPFTAADLRLPFKTLLSLGFNTNEPYYQFVEPYTVDFSNVESISVRDSDIRPMILVKTKNEIVNRKTYINSHLNLVVYKNQPNQFYQPTYETKKQIENVAPDTRDILFWTHSIMTDSNGEAKFSYYNADRPQIVQIRVEGIAANGELGVNQLEYNMLDERIGHGN